MEKTVLRVHYPLGWIPVIGFRCRVCGDEAFLPDDTADSRRLAETLGLFGVQDSGTRKLLRTGNSLAVSLDPALVREVLGSIKPGDPVRVSRQGNRIVIEPAAES